MSTRREVKRTGILRCARVENLTVQECPFVPLTEVTGDCYVTRIILAISPKRFHAVFNYNP
jgi:hypothetical protein